MARYTLDHLSSIISKPRALSSGFLLGCLLLCGCNEKKKEPVQAPPAASAPQKNQPLKPKSVSAPLQKGYRFPVGPQLVLLPGTGMGAIRFGATFDTIERHMGAPCDIRTETRCGYVRQAVEMTLDKGVLTRIKTYRRDLPVSPTPKKGDKYYGSFNGIMVPKVMMGLHRHIVVEEFGKPLRKEASKTPDKLGHVDTHYYDGVILAYDKIENGNTVLATIEIFPSKTAASSLNKVGAPASVPPSHRVPEPTQVVR